MQEPAKPWYRQLTPWLLLAGPIIVIVAGVYTAYLAARGHDGLVVDDYYKEGKAINQVLTRDRAAAAAGLRASLVLGQDRRTLRVLLTRRDEASAAAASAAAASGMVSPDRGVLTLRLQHPTRSEADVVLPLKEQAPQVYQGVAPRPLHGRWYVSLEDPAWRLTGEWNLGRADSVELAPTKP